MAKFAVDDQAAVDLGTGPMLIQNLGDDEIFLSGGAVPEPDAETGLRVSSGEAVSVKYNERGYWAVSVGTSDVRTLVGCDGIFPVVMPAE